MSDTELTPEQKADLETWDNLAHQPPWPFATRRFSTEEWDYLAKLRQERREAERQATAERAAAERAKR